jgi:hypothetical protein
MATVFKKHGLGDWQFEYTNEFGRRRRQSSRTTEKRAAESAATSIDAEVAKRLSGGLSSRDIKLRAEDQRPFRDHVDDYVAHLKLYARADRHIEAVKKCLLALGSEVGIARLHEAADRRSCRRAWQARGHRAAGAGGRRRGGRRGSGAAASGESVESSVRVAQIGERRFRGPHQRCQ